MSDFNRSSHDFKGFVEKLTKIDPASSGNVRGDEKTQREPFGSRSGHAKSHVGGSAAAIGRLDFEPNLFFVSLPDFNNFRKPCPHEGVRSLFHWLHGKGVKQIDELNMPDSTTSPMSDELVYEAILNVFTVRRFDWRKLDINLDILTRNPDTAKAITHLTLYSSGNWSTLYHWTSVDGLPRLTSVCLPFCVSQGGLR